MVSINCVMMAQPNVQHGFFQVHGHKQATKWTGAITPIAV